jgi:hypothetical protein
MAAAVDLGFKRAWPSIRDSNMSTMITCAILYWFGNNFGATIIVGFAVNLFIGVVISLFTAVVVTRNFLNLLVPTGLAAHPALFGLPTEALNVPRYQRPVSRVAPRASKPVAAAVLAGSGARAAGAATSDGASDAADEMDAGVDADEAESMSEADSSRNELTGNGRNGSTPESGQSDALGTRGLKE